MDADVNNNLFASSCMDDDMNNDLFSYSCMDGNINISYSILRVWSKMYKSAFYILRDVTRMRIKTSGRLIALRKSCPGYGIKKPSALSRQRKAKG